MADTVEHAPGVEAETTYDAFISYSHAADGLLAPRLQSALQRFAKPWWQRRAMRVFRDESSLSANPHLWSSITEALDSSAWFVLLLSPEAAASEWVNQEIEYWRTHKDPARILPVVTDGEFDWTGTGTAFPPALAGAFTEEPRWVDLRWARADEQLDLNNARFRNATADIASTVRGVPKDELESEEVRQHRRTRRTAWSAGLALLALVIVASVFGIVALNESRQAEEQADLAQAEADRANSERDRANQETERAEVEADRANTEADRAATEAVNARAAEANAVVQAQLARSRELAAAAASSLESDAELAAMLAVVSARETPEGLDPSVETVRALRRANQENRLVHRIEGVPGWSQLVTTPDGTTVIVASNQSRSVTAIDIVSGTELWEYVGVETVDLFNAVDVSPDGRLVAVAVWNTNELDDPSVPLDDEGQDGLPARLLVLDATNGALITTVVPGECDAPWFNGGFSHDGTVIGVRTGSDQCFVDADGTWISLIETATWTEIGRINVDGYTEDISFATDAPRFIVTDAFSTQPLRVYSYPELELIQEFDFPRGISFPAISPDGTKVTFNASAEDVLSASQRLHDVETGDFLGYVQGHDRFLSGVGAVFGPASETVAVMTRRHEVVANSLTGEVIARLGSPGPTMDAAFTPDGNTLVSVEQDSGDVLIWALSDERRSVAIASEEADAVWINPDRLIDGPYAAALTFADNAPLDPWLFVFDELSGEVEAAVRAANATQLSDGRFILNHVTNAGVDIGPQQSDMVLHGLSVWHPDDGLGEQITVCETLLSATEPDQPTATCADGGPAYAVHDLEEPWIVVSPDETVFAAGAHVADDAFITGEMRDVGVWDLESLGQTSWFEVHPDERIVALGETWLVTTETRSGGGFAYNWRTGERLAELPVIGVGPATEVLADRGLLLVQAAGRISVIDTGDWSLSEAWQAHASVIRGLAISGDGTRLATAGEDGAIRIWDISELGNGLNESVPLMDELNVGIASDVRWIHDSLLGLAIREGEWATASLDVGELVSQVASRLTRGFNLLECQTFQLEPCPTLDHIRTG